MEQRLPLTDVAVVAGRLQGIREASGLTQTAFAKRMGILYTSWNAYERAEALISVVSARKVRSKTGVSLDYIYEGDCSKLPADLMDKLDEYGLRRAKAG